MNWSEWGRIHTDVGYWRPVVRQIGQDTGTAAANVVEASYPGTCAVFVVDRQVVVKIYPPFLRRDFRRELEVYQLLGGYSAIPLPYLLAQGVYAGEEEWPYLVLQFRPGQPIRELYPLLAPMNKEAIGRHLGRIICAIHDAPLTSLQHFDTRPSAWADFIAQRRAACPDELRQQTSLPESVIAEVPGFLAAAGPLVASDFRPRLLHADLTEDHLLLERQGREWRIAALIDLADAEVGAPEYEWVALWFSLCGRDRAMFTATLHAYDPTIRLDETFCQRMMAHTLLHRFGAGIIADAVKRHDAQPFNDLAGLQEWLWNDCYLLSTSNRQSLISNRDNAASAT